MTDVQLAKQVAELAMRVGMLEEKIKRLGNNDGGSSNPRHPGWELIRSPSPRTDIIYCDSNVEDFKKTV